MKGGFYAEKFIDCYFLIAVLVAGCDKGPDLKMKEGGENITRLKIERCVVEQSNPYLVFLAKKINIDYNQRTIVIEGLINFTGDNSGGYHNGSYVSIVFPELKIQDNNLIINIPNDAEYHLWLGNLFVVLN